MNRAIISALLVLGSVAPAASQSLGIFADSLGTLCNLDVPFPGGLVTAYVVARTDDVEVPVFTAAFRIVGMPPGWTATLAPPSETLLFGDAVGDGAFVLFDCVPPVSPRLLLKLTITPTSLIANARLSIGYNLTRPSMCSIEQVCEEACPRFCACGAFEGPCYCAETTDLIINGAPCTTPVTQASWEYLKLIYR